MRYILPVVFAFLIKVADAQVFPSELWHPGKVILLEGDTLKGSVKYDLKENIVQYNLNGDNIQAFTARKVLFFEIFDNSVHKYRQFFALPYSINSTYKTPTFFELLEEGKLTLLCRESLEYRTYSSPYAYGGSYSRLVLVNHFYLLRDEGDITEFAGNKNDLLDLMGKQSQAVEQYMKENKLKPDDKDDFTKIITFYNSLFGT